MNTLPSASDLEKIKDPTQFLVRSFVTDGTLSVVDAHEYPLRRVFWVHDLHQAKTRGGHAHKKLKQFLVAINGTMKVRAYKPDRSFTFWRLNDPKVGLYVPPGNWLSIYDFDPRTILLVLASDVYDTEDYIHREEDFFRG